MTDCCNAIAANGEAGVEVWTYRVNTPGPVVRPISTRPKGYALSRLLITIFLSIARGKSRH